MALATYLRALALVYLGIRRQQQEREQQGKQRAQWRCVLYLVSTAHFALASLGYYHNIQQQQQQSCSSYIITYILSKHKGSYEEKKVMK